MSYELHEFQNIKSYEQLPDRIVDSLKGCINSAFGGGVTREDALQHMAGDYIMIATSGVKVVGFCSTSLASPASTFNRPDLSDQNGAYFAGAAIHRDMQGNGLYGVMNDLRLQFALNGGVDFVFTRTQNPRVEEGITSSIQKMAERKSIIGFELGKITCIAAYGKMLTDKKPIAKSLTYDDLNYERGDGFIVTWRLIKEIDRLL